MFGQLNVPTPSQLKGTHVGILSSLNHEKLQQQKISPKLRQPTKTQKNAELFENSAKPLRHTHDEGGIIKLSSQLKTQTSRSSPTRKTSTTQ